MITTYEQWVRAEGKKVRRLADAQHPAVAAAPARLAGKRTVLFTHPDLPGQAFRRRRQAAEAACEAITAQDARDLGITEARESTLTPAQQDAALRHVRKARLTQGIRAGQRAWWTSGLMITPSMIAPGQMPPDGQKH